MSGTPNVAPDLIRDPAPSPSFCATCGGEAEVDCATELCLDCFMDVFCCGENDGDFLP